MRNVNRVRGSIIAFILGISCLVIGCSTKINDTNVEVSFSQFTGENIREINLNSYDNTLNMSGKIELKSGTVDLYIKAKGTDIILYTLTVTTANAGNITIDIPDLNNNRNLLFILKAHSAKNFKLSLTSKQKLILDKETPETPETPKTPKAPKIPSV